MQERSWVSRHEWKITQMHLKTKKNNKLGLKIGQGTTDRVYHLESLELHAIRRSVRH